jgi:hypothetical protein
MYYNNNKNIYLNLKLHFEREEFKGYMRKRER